MTNRWNLEEALGPVHLLEEVGGRLEVVERLRVVEGVLEGVDEAVGQPHPLARLLVAAAAVFDEVVHGRPHPFQPLDGLQELVLEDIQILL